MPLQPVARRSVPDEVFDQIVSDVVSGHLAPGDSLPSERRLAEALGVSRPAVREALQRLAHAGFVEVRQGDATTVRDFTRHAGPELLPRLLLVGGEVNLDVVRSVFEARLLVGPFVAALAADRADPALAARLDESLADLRAAPDTVGKQRAALAFWDHVVDGADSIVFRLMYNSMRAFYEPALAAVSTVMDAEVSNHDAYARLARAIATRNATASRRAAEAVLEPSTKQFLTALEAMKK